MEKIIVALDSICPGSGALSFACYLAELNHSKIVGVFLEPLEETGTEAVRETKTIESRHGQNFHSPGKDIIAKQVQHESISFFTHACEKKSILHSVHIHNGDPEKALIRESRYADLLIIDPGVAFQKNAETLPSSFVKNVLQNAECPVVIAPDIFEGIEEIVFACNGSKSSMLAIKQFCYLFPMLDDKKVTLLKIDNGSSEYAQDHEYQKEWLSAHYSAIGFVTLTGDTETELLGYLLKKENLFIVMGAYGRSMMSRLFKRSSADCVIRSLDQAIFIAHG